MRDKGTRQCPQTTFFLRQRRAEADSNRGPPAYQPNALPLGQTGSLPRTVVERLTCDLVTSVSNRCERIKNVWFGLMWPYAVDGTFKSKNHPVNPQPTRRVTQAERTEGQCTGLTPVVHTPWDRVRQCRCQCSRTFPRALRVSRAVCTNSQTYQLLIISSWIMKLICSIGH